MLKRKNKKHHHHIATDLRDGHCYQSPQLAYGTGKIATTLYIIFIIFIACCCIYILIIYTIIYTILKKLNMSRVMLQKVRKQEISMNTKDSGVR